MEKEPFLPGSIDEQIKHLAQVSGPELPDERLIHDTYTLYQEYERSRDRVWARLQERMNDDTTSSKQELPIENEKLRYRRHNRMKQHVLQPGQTGIQRFGLIAAIIFATLLIGSMITIVQMAHHTIGQTGQMISRPWAPQDTASSAYVGNSGGVVRMDAKTGKSIWAYKLPAAGPNALMVPTVLPEGNVIYITVKSFDPTIKSAITALNAQNGHVLWSLQFGADSQINGLVFDNGIVYGEVTSNSARASAAAGNPEAVRQGSQTTGSIVYALNAASGKEQSIYRINGGITNIAVSSGVLYATADQTLSAIDLNSKQQLWSVQVGSGGAKQFLTAPHVANNAVFIGLETFNQDGTIFAYNAHTGAKLWQSDTVNTETSNLTVTNNVVYFGSMQGTIYAYDAQHGHRLWSLATSGTIETAPVVANGVLYVPEFVGSRTSPVHALAVNASNGHKQWEVSLDGGEILSLTLSHDMLYLSTFSDGNNNSVSKVYGIHSTNGSKVWTSSIRGNTETVSVNA